jgi:hypothetical protein
MEGWHMYPAVTMGWCGFGHASLNKGKRDEIIKKLY